MQGEGKCPFSTMRYLMSTDYKIKRVFWRVLIGGQSKQHHRITRSRRRVLQALIPYWFWWKLANQVPGAHQRMLNTNFVRKANSPKASLLKRYLRKTNSRVQAESFQPHLHCHLHLHLPCLHWPTLLSKLSTSIGSSKNRRVPEFCFIDYAKAFDCVDHNKLWKILQEMGIPDPLTCLLRNMYASQEATIRTGHRTIDWFQIGKGVGQGCKLSPCLFNLYAEYIMQKARLDEAQAEIKIARKNINNFRYADDTSLWQKAKKD